MKKLTAGIFATLLAVVSTGAANAEIASKGYVDQQVGTKADAATVTSLSSTVSGHTSQIGTINTNLEKKADKATTLSGYGITDAYTSAEGTALEGRVAAVEAPKATVATGQTGPVSGQTVFNAIQGVTGDVSGVTSDVGTLKTEMAQAKEDISALETASANHVVKNEVITGGTHTKITYDAKGLVTAGADLTADDIPTIPNTKVSGLGALATKSSVATADIASKAVTKEKLADDIVTSLGKADSALQKTTADTTYAVKALESQVGTVSKENMGTTTATTVVGGVKEAIEAAKAADTKAANAASAASTADGKAVAAQGAVDTLEETVTAQGTRLTTAEGDIDTIQGQISNMATNETVEGLQSTVTNLQSTKQDKTDNTLTTTNKTVVGAINEVKATADKKQDKLTGTVGGSMQPVYLNNGTITAGTALGTLATKSKVTNTEVDDGALAQSKINGLATTLAAKLTTPPTSERGETGLYVLTYDGTDFQWEDIARTVE